MAGVRKDEPPSGSASLRARFSATWRAASLKARGPISYSSPTFAGFSATGRSRKDGTWSPRPMIGGPVVFMMARRLARSAPLLAAHSRAPGGSAAHGAAADGIGLADRPRGARRCPAAIRRVRALGGPALRALGGPALRARWRRRRPRSRRGPRSARSPRRSCGRVSMGGGKAAKPGPSQSIFLPIRLWI